MPSGLAYRCQVIPACPNPLGLLQRRGGGHTTLPLILAVPVTNGVLATCSVEPAEARKQ